MRLSNSEISSNYGLFRKAEFLNSKKTQKVKKINKSNLKEKIKLKDARKLAYLHCKCKIRQHTTYEDNLLYCLSNGSKTVMRKKIAKFLIKSASPI